MVALCGVTTPAFAQWGVSAGGSLGSTTNGGTTKGDIVIPELMAGDEVTTDAFVRTAVGAEYLARTRRSAHQFTYNFANFVHFGEGRLLSFSNDLLWLGAMQLGRETELSLNVSGSQGRTGDLYLFNNQQQGASVARPTTSTWFAGAHVGQVLASSFGDHWSVAQDLGGDAFFPIGAGETQAQTMGADAHLGLAYRFTTDRLGLRAGVGHGRSTAITNDAVGMIPARRANFADALLVYNHAFNDDWDASFGAGLLGVQVPQIRDPFLDASFSASVDHRTMTGGIVSAQAARGVVTNVFVGDTLLQTSAGLRFTQFFGRNEAFQAVGGVDFQTGKSVFVIDEKQGGLDVFAIVASLNYEYSRHIMLDLEANYTYQNAEASRRGTMFLPPYTLHRGMVMASIAYVFPQPEKLTGGAGGRRRPRAVGRPGGSASDVRTGLEAVLDPSSRLEGTPGVGDGEGGAAGSGGARSGRSARPSRDGRADRRDAARGYDPEESPTALPPGVDPSRDR